MLPTGTCTAALPREKTVGEYALLPPSSALPRQRSPSHLLWGQGSPSLSPRVTVTALSWVTGKEPCWNFKPLPSKSLLWNLSLFQAKVWSLLPPAAHKQQQATHNKGLSSEAARWEPLRERGSPSPRSFSAVTPLSCTPAYRDYYGRGTCCYGGGIC